MMPLNAGQMLFSMCEIPKPINREIVREKYELICKPAVLNKTQISALTDPSADNTLYRICSYIKDHPSVFYKVFTCDGESFTMIDAVLYGGAAFAGAMSVLGIGAEYPPGTLFVWNEFLESYVPVFPDGTFVTVPSIGAVLAGAGIGIAVVANINISRNIYKTCNSNATKLWKQIRRNFFIKASKKRVLLEDDVLKDFLCPIKKDIPVCPVRAPNYCTYDKNSIKNYLKNNPGKFPPGGSEVSFAARQLIFDFPYANTVICRYDEILKTIDNDISLVANPHLNEFSRLFHTRRDCIQKQRLNNISPSFSHLVQSLAGAPPQPIVFGVPMPIRAPVNPENLSIFNSKIARKVQAQKDLKRVRICTNNAFELFFISIFGWLGAKKTMVDIDVHCDEFEDIEEARRKRTGEGMPTDNPTEMTSLYS